MNILQRLFEVYKENQSKQIGEDGRYHTVYVILLETGSFYIGKHSTTDIDTDAYICSGKIANREIKRQNGQYTRHVTHYFNTAKDALALETQLLEQSDIFNNELCLNQYAGHPPDKSGYIRIVKDNYSKQIPLKSLSIYTQQGWQLGGARRIIVHKNGTIKHIPKCNLTTFLEAGWQQGNPNTRDRVFVTDGEIFKYIKRTDVAHLQDGWRVQHNVTDRIVIEKDNQLKKVYQHELAEYLESGWLHSSTVRDLKFITKDGEFKRVSPDRVQYFLDKGWKIGTNFSDKLYITNGKDEKRIQPEKLDSYAELGWAQGRLPVIRIHNGKIEKRIRTSDAVKLQRHIDDGWVIGKVPKVKQTIVWSSSGGKKYIQLEQVDEFISQGWYRTRQEALQVSNS